jgi:putative transposase
MAEAFNALFKAECIRNPAMRPRGGWQSVSDVEIAVAEYIDWLNHRRLHGEHGLVPPSSSRPPTGPPATASATVRTRSSPWAGPR